MMVWARAMKLNLGPLQIDLASFGPPAPPTPTPGTPATIGQLIRYCEGRLGQLERDFPESDLVRFMIQRGI